MGVVSFRFAIFQQKIIGNIEYTKTIPSATRSRIRSVIPSATYSPIWLDATASDSMVKNTGRVASIKRYHIAPPSEKCCWGSVQNRRSPLQW